MTEESSRLLKVVLGMLFVLLLAGVVFLTLTKKSAQNSTPVTTNQVKTPVPSPEAKTPTENVAPVPVSQSAPLILPVEDQKTIGTIQDQLNAGTLTPEEAVKQMKVIQDKIASPTPTAVQK